MSVSATSIMAMTHQDWDSNGTTTSSAMFTIERIEIARMKSS